MGPQQPSKALRVRIVTFNMNFKAPAEVPDELLGRAGCPDGLKKYDIVVVGTQESGPLQVMSLSMRHTEGEEKYCKLWPVNITGGLYTCILCPSITQPFI